MAKKSKVAEELEDFIPLVLDFYPWHEEQKHFLFNLTNQKRLHHAFLFYGSANLGKFDFACAMAAALLCEDKKGVQQNVACQNCHACHLVRSMTHPDIYVLRPEKEGKQIPVDEIRQLIDFMSKSSGRSGRRMIIIDQCQQMNLNAANALLKFLEEPGEHVHIFLISAELNSLLPTIRSRCQKLSFSAPSLTQASLWFKDFIEGDPEQSLLEYAGASPLLAIQMQEEAIYLERKAILAGLKALLQGRGEIVAYTTQWSEYSLVLFLEWWHACLCDVLKLAAGADIQHLRFQSLYAEIEVFAATIDKDALPSFMDEIFLLRQLLARGAPLTQGLVLESLLVQWQTLAK